MRRDRSLRNFREYLLRRGSLPSSQRVLQKQIDIRNAKSDRKKIPVPERNLIPVKSNSSIKSPASSKLLFSGFPSTDSYVYYPKKQIRICHIIDSFGMGGAQTMMFELINGLKKYYSLQVENYVVLLTNPPHEVSYDKKFPSSYGIYPDLADASSLEKFCLDNAIDVVMQHRTHSARCLKASLPDNVKYILINHTVNNLHSMSSFLHCDAYVSVCDYLKKMTTWPSSIHESRRISILNGVEINNGPMLQIADGFISGRCHRLIPSKFKIDSLKWIDSIKKEIPNHVHCLIGNSKVANSYCDKSSSCKYLGPIANRDKKMSIIKGFDVYFYDTYGHEGASVAILEALASGVPVICKSYGGNTELIKNRVNGFIVNDLKGFIKPLKDLYKNPLMLAELKIKTIEDFNNRLHIRHTACKYVQLVESLVGANH